jgi:hypothetical protein
LVLKEERAVRIEVTSYEEKPKAVNIDFEYGAILVNLQFTKEELENLHGIVVEELEKWEETLAFEKSKTQQTFTPKEGSQNEKT